jgi:hypothetical protein
MDKEVVSRLNGLLAKGAQTQLGQPLFYSLSTVQNLFCGVTQA